MNKLLLIFALGLSIGSCVPVHAEAQLPDEMIQHLTPTVDLVLTGKPCAQDTPAYGQAAFMRFNTTGRLIHGCWQQHGDRFYIALLLDKQVVNLNYLVQKFTPITYF